MPGPLPKDPKIRQRTNQTVTRATLVADDQARRRVPKLPKRSDDGEWRSETKSWWREFWRSPMAGELLPADVHRVYILAELVNQFWTSPTTSLATEIRLQGMCFGLTPIDRRRLQWEVVPPMPEPEMEPTKLETPVSAKDPRDMLRVLA
jgi:hypothetical protein